MTPGTLHVIPVTGIGEMLPGDDVAAVILEALAAAGDGPELRDGDIVVVTHKIVSKAEGRLAEVPDDDAYRALVEEEAAAVIRRRGAMVITITRHGFICANAGVDRSNVEPGRAVLLPVDPDRSAHRIRTRLERASGVRLAVVVTDTFGRPWRRGLTDVAIGVSGMNPIRDYRGTTDTHGRVLDVTEVAVVDEIAAAADLVMGKVTAVPVAVVRGLEWSPAEGRATDLVRPPSEDMFR
jgi:coenzyme F420-0:L-glutamate ligase/coenzyme F420-1:gamma-L-glutamate ligase